VAPVPETDLVDKKLPITVAQARTVSLTIVRLELTNSKRLAAPLCCRLGSAHVHRSDALEATLCADPALRQLGNFTMPPITTSIAEDMAAMDRQRA
jgi:hypothetical protein